MNKTYNILLKLALLKIMGKYERSINKIATLHALAVLNSPYLPKTNKYPKKLSTPNIGNITQTVLDGAVTMQHDRPVPGEGIRLNMNYQATPKKQLISSQDNKVNQPKNTISSSPMEQKPSEESLSNIYKDKVT